MSTPTAKDVAEIVGYVGEIVGKTKLQKTAALLEITGLGVGFSFSYYLFGPYSDDLTSAIDRGVLLGLIKEEEKVANWGGKYSIFRSTVISDDGSLRSEVVKKATRANSVVLELAATAAFLASEGEENAWNRVAELKADKASAENLRKAKELYSDIAALPTPDRLPNIPL